jgi:D-glycero-D-manno-heptose 1,7-bisphosphate phosphatase
VTAPAKPDVFLDRDGVIIRHRVDYVRSWSEVEPLPGAVAAIGRLCRAGHRVMVVTNQSAVGRGLLDQDVLDDIHQRLAGMVRHEGGEITHFFVCPHHPEAGCDCRKPRPGLLLQAAEQFGSELDGAFLVGDQPSDVSAARSAGCRPILVGASGSERARDRDAAVTPASDLAAAADLIITLCA